MKRYKKGKGVIFDGWFAYQGRLLEYLDVDLKNKRIFGQYIDDKSYIKIDDGVANRIMSDLNMFIDEQKFEEINYVLEDAAINIYDFL